MRPSFRIPIAVAATFLAGFMAGCSRPASETKQSPATPAATEPSQSSAAKSEELQRKADDYQDRMREIQASDMTPEQKAQAASELVDAQQKTIQEAEPAGSNGESPD